MSHDAWLTLISGRDEWVSGRLHSCINKAAHVSRMLIARFFYFHIHASQQVLTRSRGERGETIMTLDDITGEIVDASCMSCLECLIQDSEEKSWHLVWDTRGISNEIAVKHLIKDTSSYLRCLLANKHSIWEDHRFTRARGAGE
jgi:hypothetical protein